MVPSVGHHQFIYRLLCSDYLPLKQKYIEILWNSYFYYRLQKYSRQTEIHTHCLCLFVHIHVCSLVDLYYYRAELSADIRWPVL